MHGTSDMEANKEPVASTLWDFVLHSFLITTAFLIVYLFALGLHWISRLLIYLRWIDEHTFLADVFDYGEKALLAGDLVLLVALIVIRGYRAAAKF